MLNEQQLKQVKDFAAAYTAEQLIWISGYLAGVAGGKVPAAAGAGTGKIAHKITLAYGTETGNSKKIMTQLSNAAKKAGAQVKLIALDQYKAATELAKEEYFFLALSTHGDGEAPDAAKKFYEFVHSAEAPKLDKLKFGIIALGDTAYPLFCQAGVDIDVQFEKLGGKRLLDRIDCDVDYTANAEAWVSNVLALLSENHNASAPVLTAVAPLRTGRHIYHGKVGANVNLNDRGSAKETYHIEIETAEAVTYEPGDSLGVIPHNPADKVNRIIQLLQATGGEKVKLKDEDFTLEIALGQKLNLLRLPKRVTDKFAALTYAKPEDTLYDLDELLELAPLPKDVTLQDFIAILEPIAPRYYSIASSPNAHAGAVHILVSRVVYKLNEKPKGGLASNFLADFKEGQPVSFFIQRNEDFKLPSDDKNIIMVGPGTGVAPFRSFVAERDYRGADGKSWLFFGDQHFISDFLYQSEWQDYLSGGALTKLDVAFSRDQQEKVYVQTKLQKQSGEVFQWLEGGAYFYVCGSKDPMSHDVEHTLLSIISTEGKMEKESAVDYLNKLKDEGRYVKDVY
jgi:sulfite reductase (NADPH) flavoprotein alpha-component